MIAQLEPIQFLEAQVAQQETLIEEQRQLIVELRSKVTYCDQQRREALDALRAAKLEAHKNKIDYEHMHSRCDNLLAERERLVQDNVIGRKIEHELREQLVRSHAHY